MNEQARIVKSLTSEEQDLLYFVRPVGYHTRLQQYWEYPESFAEGTTLPKSTLSLSTTKTFRHYLRHFIRNFRPEELLPNENLWLCLERNGRFFVSLEKDGEEIMNLSEAKNYVFQYLCFLHIRRFWNGLRRCCRFPAVQLPALIRDFSGQLEEKTDYDALLQRALAVSSQILVL